MRAIFREVNFLYLAMLPGIPQGFQTIDFIDKFKVARRLGISRHGEIIPILTLGLLGGILWPLSYPLIVYLGPIYEREDMEKHACAMVN